MNAYYQDVGQKGFKGRRRMTLPLVLNRDLKHENVGLKTSRDLQELRNLAQDRGEWSALTSRVIEAGEAEESDDNSAGRPNLKLRKEYQSYEQKMANHRANVKISTLEI